jgi:ribosome biogenesis protein Nip4
MKTIEEFIKIFTDKEIYPQDELVKQGREYYLQKQHIQKTAKNIQENLIHAGLFLGEIKSNQFTVSLHLLELIAPHTDKKIILDEKTAWLFACNRDVFTKQVQNNKEIQQGSFVIVLNEQNEVLGLAKKEKDKTETIYKNILDIGSYLRKEQDKKR